MHWKKKYFQLSKNYSSVPREMNELLAENGMAEKNEFLTGLIRYDYIPCNYILNMFAMWQHKVILFIHVGFTWKEINCLL